MTALDRPCGTCSDRHRLGRRRFLGTLAAGVALALTGSRTAGASNSERLRRRRLPLAPEARIVSDPGSGPPLDLGTIPSPRPGSPVLFWGGPATGNRIAITLDDGYCGSCIASYVAFAQSSGLHLTFNPNGQFSALWTPHLETMRQMIADRQVQIGNHTFNHLDLRTLSASGIVDQLNRNEEWIEQAFGVTGRPWFRPPYGYYDSRINDVAGSIGYTNILMWNGSFGDSTPISPQQLLELANQYLTAGTIMLGHLNHHVIFPLWPQIQEIIAQRRLDPVTLDEMFGTTRSSG